MSFTVHVVARARRDVATIFHWLAKRSQRGARLWEQAFENALGRLAIEAASFPPAFEAQRVGRAVREYFFKTRYGKRYRIVFIIDGSEVHVLRIRGPGQRRLRRSDLQ